MKKVKLKAIVVITIILVSIITVLSFTKNLNKKEISSDIEQNEAGNGEIVKQWKIQNNKVTATLYSDERLVFSGNGPIDNSIKWSDYKEQIHKIEINEGITAIGWRALSGFERQYIEVILNNTVINIDNDAFEDSFNVNVIYSSSSNGEYIENYVAQHNQLEQRKIRQAFEQFRMEVENSFNNYTILGIEYKRVDINMYLFTARMYDDYEPDNIIRRNKEYRTTSHIENIIKDNTAPNLNTVNANDGNWTNQNVKLTVTASDNFSLADKPYSFDNGVTWQANNSIEYSDNMIQKVSVYLKDVAGNVREFRNIAQVAIDKIKPEVKTLTATANTIRIQATDEASGIVGYAITENNTQPALNTFINVSTTNSLDITYEGIQQNKTYYVWVKDKAGNISESKQIKTSQIPTLEEAKNVSIYKSPENWTNGKVRLAIETSAAYNLQISTDGQNWETTNSKTFVREYSSNVTVYARLYEGSNYGGQMSHSITNIDTTQPDVSVVNTTTNSIQIQATDSQSKITEYAISTSSTPDVWKRPEGGQPVEHIDVIEKNLTQNTTYNIFVKDLAGNIAQSTIARTQTVPTAEGNVAFSKSTNEFTNGKVTVTAVKVNSVEGYTLETSRDNTNWKAESTIEYNENGTMYARLKDSTGQIGAIAIYNITNIDKIKPEILNETTATTNSITIIAKDEQSKIIGYTITTNTQTPTNFSEIGENSNLNVTVNNLKQNTQYYIWVKDKAGNISEYKAIKTVKIPDLVNGTNVTFTPSTTELTTKDVTVTVSTTETEYTLQTSKDGTNWITENKQTYTDNGRIYARLVDNIGQTGSSALYDITNIEKTPPTIHEVKKSSTSWTNTRVTITINATDDRPGLASKPYSFDNGHTWQESNTKIYDQSQEGIIIKVKDGLGNIATYETINIDNIDIDAPIIDGIEKKETKQDGSEVTLTITAHDTQSGLAEEAYSFDSGKTWQTSNKKTFNKNVGQIYVLVRDKVYNVSSEVVNISGISEEQPLSVTSEKYEIKDEYIQKVPSGENIEALIKNITIKNAKSIKIYNPDKTEAKNSDTVKTGTTISIDEKITYKIVVTGDANSDGKVDFSDILLINKHRLNKAKLINEYFRATDVNGDGQVNINDLLQINKFRLKKIEKL